MINQKTTKYAFILGHVPDLSVAEIKTVLKGQNLEFKEILLTKDVFIIEVGQELDVKGLQEQLGGTIKIALIADRVERVELSKKIDEVINSKFPGIAGTSQISISKETPSTKFQFGFSLFGKLDAKEFQTIGLTTKRKLKDSGVSCRFVTSKEKSLSAVIVTKEHLLDQGLDLVIIEDGGRFYLGQTLAVQDWQNYSDRDYGRPSRDDKSGMLPPKLAKIMINLAGAKPARLDQSEPADVLLDPFCGSGTILQEALLMGYYSLIGSDISAKAVLNSQNNLNWLKTKYRLNLANVKIYELDVRNLEHKLEAESVSAIVTEPYLGEQDKSKVKRQKFEDLENLYLDAFRQFYKVLKPGGQIVIVLPIINGQPMNILPQIEKIGFTLDKLSDNQRGSIVYGREGQRVEREIFLFMK